jgi:hypothetical protein
MQPRIYTYKVTFEEIPHWYWGIHKEKKFNELYLGSPVTHRWMWEFYTPQIQILEIFPFNEKGWEEANSVERRLIFPDLQKPLCLNENCAGVMSWEICRKNGSQTLKKAIERNPNHQSEVGALGAKRLKELGTGIHIKENQVKGGLIAGPIPVWNNGEYQIKSWYWPGEPWVRGNIPHANSLEALRKGGELPWWTDGISEKRSYETPGEGWTPGRSPKPLTLNFNYESSRKSGKKSMDQLYKDPDHLELGSKPAPVLVRMQKSRGYPHGPSNRVRVE